MCSYQECIRVFCPFPADAGNIQCFFSSREMKPSIIDTILNKIKNTRQEIINEMQREANFSAKRYKKHLIEIIK